MTSTSEIIAAIVARLSEDVPAVTWAAYDADLPGDPDLPFGFVEELPAQDNRSILSAISLYPHRRTMSVVVLVAAGEIVYPSPEDAAVKVQIWPLRDDILTSLLRSPIYGNVSKLLADETNLLTDTVGPIPYNKRPFMGVYFSMPMMVQE